MGQSFLYRMPVGIPGELTRASGSTVESHLLNAAAPFSAFGLPGKISGGKFVPITATGDAVTGFLMRVYPSSGPNASDPIGTAVPPTSGIANVLSRASGMTVQLQAGAATAADGLPVYCRFQNAGAGKIIGGLEGITSADVYPIPGARFLGAADANGNVEIAFNV